MTLRQTESFPAKAPAVVAALLSRTSALLSPCIARPDQAPVFLFLSIFFDGS